MKEKNKKWLLEYEFIPEGRLFIGSGHGKYTNVDQTVYLQKQLTVDENGQITKKYAYPATSIKGKLRANFTKIISQLSTLGICRDCNETFYGEGCPVCQLFGSACREGLLYFSNPVYAEDPRVFKSTCVFESTGVALDRKRGVAENRKLFTSEHINTGFLSGKITAHILESEANSEIWQQWLLLSLLLINNLGGKTTTGLGRGKFKITKLELGGRPILDWMDNIYSVKGEGS